MATHWNDTKWARILTSLILLALFSYGAYLRFHDLGVSLYDDEINTRERAMQSVTHTLQTRPYPLYYLSAKLALGLADSEMALRLPSFIAGLLSILAIFGLVRHLHSRSAGLVAAALLAFNPFHITHSDFARYYALLMLFTILTVWSLTLVLERGRWHQWLAYILSAFLAMASHVIFIPALAMLNVGAALYLLGQKSRGSLKRRVLQVGLLACATLIACSFVIYKEVGPFKAVKSLITFGSQPVSAATEAAPATANTGENMVGSLPEQTWTGPTFTEAHQMRPKGGGAAFTNPETGQTEYLLTYYDCLEYLKRYFWNNTTWVWPVLLFAGICGVFDVLYRVPAAGLPLFFGFFLTPGALFFRVTDHWYHPRYLSFTFVFALVFVAIGLCVVPRFLSRVIGAPRSLRLWRRRPLEGPARTASIANVLYVIAVAAMAIPAVPVINEAYQTYPVAGYLPEGPLVANRTPERDWRNLYEYVSHTVKDGDQFLFMSPKDQHGPRYARYYFSKFLPWAEEEHHFDSRFDAPTEQNMHAFATEHPFANFWCVGYLKHEYGRHVRLLREAGATQLSFWGRNQDNGICLFYLGAPTTNYLTNGDFETRMKAPLPEGAEIDKREGYQSRSSLRVRYDKAEVGDQANWARYVPLKVNPTSYRLRNNRFEAWKDGQPVGWNLGTAALGTVTPVDPGFKETRSLRITPSDDAVVLQQSFPAGLAPGRSVELQMMGLSNTANNLHLVLRYQGPGYQREEHAVHPGTGKWVLLTLAADIPADADPESLTVEVWRMANPGGDTVIDDVEFRVLGLEGQLEPHEPYVLSLMLRTEDLQDRRGADQRPAGHVRLAWTDAAGQTGHTDLLDIRQEKGWRHRALSFVPGVDIPRDVAELFVEVGLEDGTGSLWVDQVQLEKGRHPTPFTETYRLPHDETLANIPLAAFEVQAAWK